ASDASQNKGRIGDAERLAQRGTARSRCEQVRIDSVPNGESLFGPNTNFPDQVAAEPLRHRDDTAGQPRRDAVLNSSNHGIVMLAPVLCVDDAAYAGKSRGVRANGPGSSMDVYH